MSITLMSAVFACGPADQCRRFILVAIADNCDDFGFGCPGVEMIAAKACCSVRTVIRQIEVLEQEGWLKVVRHLVGRGNGYFLDIGKIGVRLAPDSFISPLHITLRRTQRAKLASIFLPSAIGDADAFSGDNPQARQVTKRRGQVTTTTKQVTPDVTLTVESPEESPRESPTEENQYPPTPLGGVHPELERAARWSRFLVALKADLSSAPATFPGGRCFPELIAGQSDFESCFRDWWMDHFTVSGSLWELVTEASKPELTRQGIAKYRKRLERLLREAFSVPTHFAVRFEVRDPVDVHHAA